MSILTSTRRERKLLAIVELGGACRDCGGTFLGRPEVFEFDHVRGKYRAISEMIRSSSWEKILEELQKCELVCANCHRTCTARRGQYLE